MDHPKIIDADVGEQRTTRHLTDGPYTLRGRLQSLVDLDVSSVGYLHAGQFEPKPFRIRRSACCDEHDPLARALARNIQLVTGKAPRFEMCPGLLEIRFYAPQGIPAYAYGPGLLSVAHGPNALPRDSSSDRR